MTTQGLVVDGTAGNDNMVGLSNYSDTLNGLDGDDTLDGGGCVDVYVLGDVRSTLH